MSTCAMTEYLSDVFFWSGDQTASVAPIFLMGIPELINQYHLHLKRLPQGQVSPPHISDYFDIFNMYI